jgi:lipopolysaccharide transport system ATP-binding protein
MNIWGTNTKRAGVPIDELSDRGYVDLQINSLPLLEGTYDLTVALSDQAEVHPFDHWEKRVRFDVHQTNIFDEGLLVLPSKWTIN